MEQMSDLGQIYVENNNRITVSNIKIIKKKKEKKIQRRQLRRQSVRKGKRATDKKTREERIE